MAKDNFCIYCGFKLFPEDHFCPNCGKKLDEADVKPNNTFNTTTRNTTSTTTTTTSNTTSQNYSYYKKQVEDLKKTYETKEEKVLELLERKFPNGQMSYGRFRGEVDVCRVNFFKEAEAAENMINLSDEYSEKIANALKEKIKTLQSIVSKMNDLQSELIISISNGDDGSDQEIDNLIKEMNDLIDSVKDYD
ncbi:MAG: hypothetical protein PUB95_06750 [Methanobrevibacter ruminantium]|uniref:hypothetical protein n=1 Tax=Methanobrevibacter ruminantium TaxID=83816 RepID=UPI0026EDA3CA|nr:hypothetical protein [Methanobrevibacter ruminantium]MCI5738101.1 hypothetical protein [Methanobrevibacter ruminantium]MDD6049138.1 hypothetical protein [Methanobrevibacter ruminantium]